MTIQRRNTKQRALVLDAVRSRCDHPTAEDIFQDVQRIDDHISRATVYRNLRLLEQTHAITRVKTPGGDRFDLRLDAHAHALCTECGAVVDVDLPYDEAADSAAAASTGFASVAHSTLFEGVCPACQSKKLN